MEIDKDSSKLRFNPFTVVLEILSGCSEDSLGLREIIPTEVLMLFMNFYGPMAFFQILRHLFGLFRIFLYFIVLWDSSRLLRLSIIIEPETGGESTALFIPLPFRHILALSTLKAIFTQYLVEMLNVSLNTNVIGS